MKRLFYTVVIPTHFTQTQRFTGGHELDKLSTNFNFDMLNINKLAAYLVIPNNF